VRGLISKEEELIESSGGAAYVPHLVLMADFYNSLGYIHEGLISRIPKNLLQGKKDIEHKDYS